MCGTAHRVRITQENLEGAMEQLKNGGFSNVGLLSLRALDQMIEACAVEEDMHLYE